MVVPHQPFLASESLVLTQYRSVTDRQTDRRTDGFTVAYTALANLALRSAVKMSSSAARNSDIRCTTWWRDTVHRQKCLCSAFISLHKFSNKRWLRGQAFIKIHNLEAFSELISPYRVLSAFIVFVIHCLISVYCLYLCFGFHHLFTLCNPANCL